MYEWVSLVFRNQVGIRLVQCLVPELVSEAIINLIEPVGFNYLRCQVHIMCSGRIVYDCARIGTIIYLRAPGMHTYK